MCCISLVLLLPDEMVWEGRPTSLYILGWMLNLHKKLLLTSCLQFLFRIISHGKVVGVWCYVCFIHG